MSGSSINMSTFFKDSNNIEVCESRFVELGLKFHENTPYVTFNTCCGLHQRLMSYPFEDVCDNLEYYIEKCYDILSVNTGICKNCGVYNGFDLTDRSKIKVVLAMNYQCSQNCSFCFRLGDLYKINIKLYNEYAKKIFDAILKCKNIITFTPTDQGEPFEIDYIKNDFLFRIHESNIKLLLILSNGIHLDKDYIEKFYNYCKKHNIVVWYTLNVSGFNKKTYESYCTSKFETMVTNVKLLSDYFGPENVVISHVVSDHNLEYKRDEIEKQFTELFPFLDPEHSLKTFMDYTKFGFYESTQMYDDYLKKDDRNFNIGFGSIYD